MIEIKVWKNVEKNISEIPWPTVVLYNEVMPDRQLITGRSSGLRPRGQTAAQTNARCYMENQNQEQEIREAIQAADYALQCLDRAESHLNSASNWGIIDMLGGGLLTTMVKHSKMDDAAADLNEARDALQRFSRELQDVHSFVDFPFNTAIHCRLADAGPDQYGERSGGRGKTARECDQKPAEPDGSVALQYSDRNQKNCHKAAVMIN